MICAYLWIIKCVLRKKCDQPLGHNHRQHDLVFLENVVNIGAVILQQHFTERDGRENMRQFLFVAHNPLDQNFGEDFPHKGIEISIALPQLKVLFVEENKRNHDFQHPLLIVDPIRLTVESGHELEIMAGAFLLEEGLAASGAEEILPEGPE